MYACLHAPDRPDALERADSFSPVIERTAPDTVIVDIGGLEALMGPPHEIARKMAEFCPNVAVAANPDTAYYAARGFAGITVIPPGREGETLAPLPLSLLTDDPRVLETFERWGLRVFRDVAALPEKGVAERLGPEGVRLRKLAHGEVSRPLRIEKPGESFEESMELEHPLTLLEPLSFLLSRQLHDICARLNAHGLAAGEVHLTLNGETRTYRPPVPVREPGTFLKLMQLDLQGTPPGKPVARVAIKADPVDPRSVQSGLFQPPTPEPEKLEITVARIANIVGKENVGVPEIVDTHRPDAFRVLPVRELATNEHEWTRIQKDNAISLRIFRPPRPLDLARISRDIARMAGPWRTSGDWWTRAPWDRDEYDIAMMDGTLYRIFRDNRTRLWFFQGSYD